MQAIRLFPYKTYYIILKYKNKVRLRFPVHNQLGVSFLSVFGICCILVIAIHLSSKLNSNPTSRLIDEYKCLLKSKC